MSRTNCLLSTAAVGAVLLTAADAVAQSGPQAPGQLWGTGVSASESSPVIREMGDMLGMVRSAQLFWQQLNALKIVGHGQWTDLETTAPGEMRPVGVYTISMGLGLPAARVDIEGRGMDRSVRVVRGDLDRAWDEASPGYPLGESDFAAFREQSIWFWPHAFARAAAYAEQGRCTDGTECTVEFTLTENGDDRMISVEIQGITYVATLDADFRPATISARIDVPNVGEAEYVAHYSGYRNGLGLGTTGEEIAFDNLRSLEASSDVGAARGLGVLDKYHTGAYIPGEVRHEVNGEVVLDLTITEGWPNAFMIFPTPELLAGN